MAEKASRVLIFEIMRMHLGLTVETIVVGERDVGAEL